MRLLLSLFFVSLYLFLTSAGSTQPTATIIQRVKKATALVDVKSRQRTATAFCVAEMGIYLTSAQAVKDIPAADKVALILAPGEAEQRVVQASIVRVDVTADLALLKTEPVGGPVALELGSSDTLVETMPITAFGCLPGKELSGRPNDGPSINVNTGHIVSLRKTQGRLNYIQLDASLNPDSFGGPVLDNSGHVVGIINADISDAHNRFAVPVGVVTQFLRRLDILFEPTVIPFLKRFDTYGFRVQLVSITQPLHPPKVTLTLTEAEGKSRSIPMLPIGNKVYAVQAAPALPRKATHTVKLLIGDQDRTVISQVNDRDFKVGNESVKLSMVGSIQGQEGKTTVILTSGKTLVGKVTGLNALEGLIGVIPTTLDLNNASSVLVEDSDPFASFVAYRVTVQENDTTLAESAGYLLLEGAPPTGRRGMLVVCADDIPLIPSSEIRGNAIYNRVEDVRTFTFNILRLFTGIRKSKILIFADERNGAFGQTFRETLRKAGHTVVVNPDAQSLDEYDVVFAGGSLQVNRALLAPYVQRGGKVYLAGGCGDEGRFWDVLLRPFGMSFGPDTYVHPPDPAPTVVTEFGNSPLFRGIKQLSIAGISPINLLPNPPPQTKILVSYNNMNIWALYISDPILPGPAPPKITKYERSPANNKWYAQVTTVNPISWQEAKSSAELMRYHGKPGHLVTITSAEENAFVVQNFPDAVSGVYWIGAYKDATTAGAGNPASGWKWVTGEAWNYTNWNPSPYQEPNGDFGTPNSNYIQFWRQGWKDTSNIPPFEADRPHGFVVEFE